MKAEPERTQGEDQAEALIHPSAFILHSFVLAATPLAM
jgi:hypothetical protein